jgi:hypothetical protein
MGKGATMESSVSTKQFSALLFLVVPVVLLLTLSGCAGFASKVIEDADQLHDSARDYVRAVHDARREIRRECWEILMAEVEGLKADGKHAEARERLAANYPKLVTIDVLEDIQNDPTGVLSEPFGCN